jgi:hypothetical protein
MNRRQVIKAAVTGSALLGLGSTGLWLSIEGTNAPLSVKEALAKLARFSGHPLTSSGQWTPYQIFSHCAQSVEYSLSGFPTHQSALFTHTLGQSAFFAFAAKGRMTHSLSEPIPGAPTLADSLMTHQDTQAALDRLMYALGNFDQFDGPLAPHFAYGALSKTEYEIAHVLHLNNHLLEIVI